MPSSRGWCTGSQTAWTLLDTQLPHDYYCRQNPVIEDIENAIDKNLSSLKTNNAKLKGLVHRVTDSLNPA